LATILRKTSFSGADAKTPEFLCVFYNTYIFLKFRPIGDLFIGPNSAKRELILPVSSMGVNVMIKKNIFAKN
jgi:hypothetical protein